MSWVEAEHAAKYTFEVPTRRSGSEIVISTVPDFRSFIYGPSFVTIVLSLNVAVKLEYVPVSIVNMYVGTPLWKTGDGI